MDKILRRSNSKGCAEERNRLEVPDALISLIEKRQFLRAAKRWDEADALRRQINTAGYLLEDTPQGTRILIGCSRIADLK
jgi:cysteinyl-tRNA synthetase